LRDRLELHGWDGAWYRRAWFDAGQPLGSASNDECRIDSIAQSWAVLAAVGTPQRQRQAMQALDQGLVRADIRAVLLLDPPFDKGVLEPGYIKGYLPGVRENGGQYTHAAAWAAMAFAQLGERAKAWQLLDLINPASADNAARIDTYKVEPYVMAADVYGTAPHAGRGGWTWYTGSAGWMYRLCVESLLGVRRHGTSLQIEPLLPGDWPGFKLHYRFGTALYHFDIRRGSGQVTTLLRDGQLLPNNRVELLDDGREHWITVECRSQIPSLQALSIEPAIGP
jgi:cellobiose phosphorylase